ncbi:Uncharacterised protein [Halioglobus japonicus]|nr:Uncharacterised protein [Halioglobus japonicus]
MMAWPAYENAKFDAIYHIQIEVRHDTTEEENVGRQSQSIDNFPVTGVVKRIFRGDDLLETEAEVYFTIAIAPGDAEIPDGADFYQDLDRFIASPYLEVFLNGIPPNLEVTASQSSIIENLSLEPTMSVPEKRVPLIPEKLRIQILESSSKARLAIDRMQNDGQELHEWDKETHKWVKHPKTDST